jgi:hypothetical protein
VKPSDEDLEAIREALHPVLGDRIRDRTAEVTSYPVPGLPERAVWRVRIGDADHPMQTYVGLWPDGRARVLSDDQPAFLDLVSAHHTEIRDRETALGYVLAFLEVTRGPTVIVRPVSDPAEIRWRPGTDDEEARRTAFLADSPIKPPSATPTKDGFQVEVWLIVDQRIQRNTFDVARDGTISAQFHVVAADLPLPIAL